jgi:CheY-like chemotaxis protein
MNLAVNSRDAMPSGGRLFIETSAATIEKDSEEAESGELRPGPYVLVSVEDTGSGMDRGTVEKIFEPFFSTKSRDKGSGLGLSTVYGIVSQYGGKIGVSSRSGRGSRFVIYLPEAEPPQVTGAPEPVGEAQYRLSAALATVLVVEDDPAVRELAVKILQEQGCRVIETRSAAHAVEQAEALQEPLHLLLTDVVMPGMKGPEVCSRIRQGHPEIKVLYMSGYSGNVLEDQEMPKQKAAFIQKPFTMQQLREKLALLLGDKIEKGGGKGAEQESDGEYDRS